MRVTRPHQAIDGRHDLWVICQEVARFDLPQTFASLRRSSREDPLEGHLDAMSADIVLTRRSQSPSPVSRKAALTCGFTL